MDAIEAIVQRAKIMADKGGQQPKYSCDICKDTEFVFTKDENGIEYAARCQCFEKKQALRLLRRSGISEEDEAKGFRYFNTYGEDKLERAKQTALDYFKMYEENKGKRNNSLLLCGASGRGKTTLGMAVANNLINSCVYVRYMPYREEIMQLKQQVTDEQTYNDHMHSLKTASVLFVDDLLKGKVTESDLNIIYEIINHRYLAKLPMIISTEKLPQELLDFDEAVGGRILEMCKGHAAVFDASIPNHRMRDFF